MGQGQANGCYLENRIDRPSKHLQCVGTLELDVELTVATFQPANGEQSRRRVGCGHLLELAIDIHREGDVAAASRQNFRVGDPVEIDHPAPGE